MLSLPPVLGLAWLFLGVATAAREGDVGTFDDKPAFPYDPNTSQYCSYWWDNDGSVSCADTPLFWGVSMEDFLRWNPSITPDCDNYLTERSYCVEAFSEPPPSPPTSSSTTARATSTTATSTSSTSPRPTTTAVPTSTLGNGIPTPTPVQPGMVSNCDSFYLVKSGDTCDTIAASKGVTAAQIISWNPEIGSTCTGLWLEYYVCVSIVGHTPVTSTSARTATTTTSAGNGIPTPTQIQPGMVSNCDSFYLVKSGDSCDTIATSNGITTAQILLWNPSVGSDCSSMWADYYICVSTIGHTPATSSRRTTTTTTSNGIPTPTPIRPGMVQNCDAFYLVKSGDTCATIASKSGVTVAQLTTWNPEVGSTCTGLWGDYYICISIVGHTPAIPTTTKGNGVTTPTPIQTGMVGNCKSFHLVKSGDTCATIASRYGITVANFTKWNPAVGSSCTGLWTNTWACIALI